MTIYYQEISKILLAEGYIEKSFNHYWLGNKSIILKITMLHYSNGGKEETIDFIGKRLEKIVEELVYLGYLKGEVPPNEKMDDIPQDATNLEVFAIKSDDSGRKWAYIGFKISNGNFHFITVPFTEPQSQYNIVI